MARSRRPGPSVVALLVALLIGIPFLPGLGVPITSARTVPVWTTQLVLSDPVSRSTSLSAHHLLEVTVALEPQDAGGLQAFLVAVQNPRSPHYHRFLTEGEFEARFSPAVTNLTGVEHYFSGFGARGFHVSADRLGLSFAIGAGAADRAFSSDLVLAQTAGGGLEQGFNSTPTLPTPLLGMISGIGGLSGRVGASERSTPHALSHGHPASVHVLPQFVTGSGRLTGTQWFFGSDYVGLYNETPLLPGNPASRANASYASSQAVATLLMSGYNASSGENLPPFDPVRVNQYFDATFPPSWPRPDVQGVPVALSGIVPPAPGPSPALADDSQDVVENALDLEMAGSTAPGAKIVNFYFPASLEYAVPNSTTDAGLADDFSNELSTALAYNYSPQHLASVSVSFGLPDLNDSLWNLQLEHAAALGVTVVAASGDAGNAPAGATSRSLGSGPGWPASAAFNSSGAISIGGTSVVASGAATGSFDGNGAPAPAYDASTGPLLRESVWYNTLAGPGNLSGSEGGGAALYPEPHWQFHSAAQKAIVAAESAQGLTSLSRAEPDLALSANTTIAYTGTTPNGTVDYALLQGTSVAAPLFAGLVAEWTAVAHERFGFLDPEIYRIECYFEAHPGLGNPFLSVTNGSNYLFSAGTGWNAAAGWGGVDASRFLNAISRVAIVGFQYSGPTPGLPAPAPSPTPLGVALIATVALLLSGVIAAVVVLGRGSRAPRHSLVGSGFPRAFFGSPGALGTISMFDCPFCGRPRPAEPVRCPTCGQL
ncbi:MAG TPA: protease pro-enzyme activation domain-containing protein [Thermoplasmata archaeon]|nr:protease pro-enzyme activation domain-containing protein [Thermoplasmata archaeon]